MPSAIAAIAACHCATLSPPAIRPPPFRRHFRCQLIAAALLTLSTPPFFITPADTSLFHARAYATAAAAAFATRDVYIAPAQQRHERERSAVIAYADCVIATRRRLRCRESDASLCARHYCHDADIVSLMLYISLLRPDFR